MRRAWAILALVGLLCGGSVTQARAVTWSTGTAIPMPEDRWEFGLIHPLRWGVAEGLELSTHPVLTLVMPHVDAKILWYDEAPLHLASRVGLAYPSLLLDLVAREGAGGLLPPTSEVPQGVIADTDLLMTLSLHDTHWLTLEAGLSVAPRGASDIPVLDFPFLYPRFAVLSAPFVLHWGLGVEGVLWEQLGYTVDVDVWSMAEVMGGWALEHGLSMTWYINETVGLSAGYRLSRSRYPAGIQLHVLPYLDVLIGL